MKRILFNIITCNRFYYSKNCLDSVLKFVDLDRIKILVCDNNTTEKGYDEYMNDMCSKYSGVLEIHKFSKRVVGEVYRAMNQGIEYAKQNKLDLVHFIQDDYQYLYRDDKHLDDALYIYDNKPKIFQSQYNLVWKKKRKKFGGRKIFHVNGTSHFLLDKRPCDNGFTRVDIFDRIGLFPKGSSFKRGDSKKDIGENWFGSQCKKRGGRRSMSLMPSLGMLYATAFVRGNKRHGKYFPPPSEFYLKPLDDAGLDQIRKRHDKGGFSFIEDVCVPDGWTPEIMYKRNDRTKIVMNI